MSSEDSINKFNNMNRHTESFTEKEWDVLKSFLLDENILPGDLENAYMDVEVDEEDVIALQYKLIELTESEKPNRSTKESKKKAIPPKSQKRINGKQYLRRAGFVSTKLDKRFFVKRIETSGVIDGEVILEESKNVVVIKKCKIEGHITVPIGGRMSNMHKRAFKFVNKGGPLSLSSKGIIYGQITFNNSPHGVVLSNGEIRGNIILGDFDGKAIRKNGTLHGKIRINESNSNNALDGVIHGDIVF